MNGSNHESSRRDAQVNRRISVVCVDDHPMVREGVRRTLDRVLDIELVGEASSSGEAMSIIAKLRPEVVVLDLSLGDDNGLELIEILRHHSPDSQILVFTMRSADPFAMESLRCGARGFLAKGSAPGELVEAIRIVAFGRRYLVPEVAHLLADLLTEPRQLSERELEILRLLAEGRRVSDIARLLHISIKTVSTHKSNIQAKMGIKSLAGLIRYAIDHRLVDG